MTTPQRELLPLEASALFEQKIVELMKKAEGKRKPVKAIRLIPHPLARALKNCGTAHIYTDTADQNEMYDLLVQSEDDQNFFLYEDVDGNTTNQPLVVKVLNRFFEGDPDDTLVAWIEQLQQLKPELTLEQATILIYSIINGRLGCEVQDFYSAGRTWEISLELHTSLAPTPEASKQIGWCLNRAVPNAFVKVPFTPHYPHSLLIARDLENQGIPVNFTATFSARQIVAAVLLANPHRTNVFLGRLSQGLGSELLGEQVVLATQRYVKQLRDQFGCRTLNMLASVRRWQTMVLTAGCDVYTVPYPVLKEFLNQQLVSPDQLENCVDKDYADQLTIEPAVLDRVGLEKIQKLYQVEPEFIEFLTKLRASAEFQTIDGDQLYKRFDEAGFGDFFYVPSATEWKELRKSKLPDLESPLTKALPLDTLYSLLAIGDFINCQDHMDGLIQSPIRHLFQG
ncbi:MAG TPA: transaldolase family protein [Acidobacteriota bacterium]|nr:transaldolase family protein [Acidobacteriota bacterium]HMZ80406.1 transaldolase family protein [Acidobacteriota bacterium]HNB72386.1 transaldolase family protein [Acidobacteriota bacterium]HNG95190.1 transaldolase family protein [Acidobacteriota bacterium]HNH84464.1 transaldolase family protein [Acidobacteriota bacterium]